MSYNHVMSLLESIYLNYAKSLYNSESLERRVLNDSGYLENFQ